MTKINCAKFKLLNCINSENASKISKLIGTQRYIETSNILDKKFIKSGTLAEVVEKN